MTVWETPKTRLPIFFKRLFWFRNWRQTFIYTEHLQHQLQALRALRQLIWQRPEVQGKNAKLPFCWWIHTLCYSQLSPEEEKERKKERKMYACIGISFSFWPRFVWDHLKPIRHSWEGFYVLLMVFPKNSSQVSHSGNMTSSNHYSWKLWKKIRIFYTTLLLK